MILLFTDFGLEGPYLGETTAVLRRMAPEVPVVNLMADAPAFRSDLAAYLLAALLERSVLPGDVVLAVVDPGVGGSRAPLACRIDDRWLVGPDNGLFEPALRRAGRAETWRIAWRPERLSASFHGRDLFAPVAARLARGERHDLTPAVPTRFPRWPDDLPAVVYVDRYGNAPTGLRAAGLPRSAVLRAGGAVIGFARTFCEAPRGRPFWYENSSGLVELALDGGSAAAHLGLRPGDPVTVLSETVASAPAAP
ncbi:SAM hydrolase/SAM-dependent halogenase family protein [Benzoatithermus flavus]|uniref:SAM-dependent chlorinase/fluorinase n=1 Tax=Benzoatithermus flavus TaxID=3108223 RepID=A0ABU8XU39_9PROT